MLMSDYLFTTRNTHFNHPFPRKCTSSFVFQMFMWNFAYLELFSTARKILNIECGLYLRLYIWLEKYHLFFSLCVTILRAQNEPKQSSVGQLPSRTITLPDDCPPDNCPPGQLPSRTIALPDNCPPLISTYIIWMDMQQP